MRFLGEYTNGNYKVTLFDDGTKIRENDLDFFKPEFPESMDIKITNYCDMGCPMCHENSNTCGKHGDIMSLKFIDTLHPYTELAIGGGNPLSHPDLIPFLEKCKTLRLIPSMTINQKHFMEDQERIKYLVNNKLIYGLGISLTDPNTVFIDKVKQYPNAVIHVIAGLVDIDDLRALASNNLKILILGYKQFRRGQVLYNQESTIIEKRIDTLKENLKEVLSWFEVVSFDNLAIKQLDPSRLLSKEEYDEFFMGNDGEFTMYVDCVNETYSVSSVSPLSERFPLADDIKEMFEHLGNFKIEEIKNKFNTEERMEEE